LVVQVSGVEADTTLQNICNGITTIDSTKSYKAMFH
jgi:hypothetical protein